MALREVLRHYATTVYAAPNLDAAVDVMSDTATQLGFVGAACVFWPCHKQSDSELPPPAIRLAGSNLGAGAASWNATYIKRELFKSDFVYRACLGTAVPIVWSYDCRPQIVLGVGQSATIRELEGIERMVRTTGLRGGVSVPIRGPGGFFGYIVFSSSAHLDELRARYEDCCDHLLGIAYRFYDAAADKLTVHDALGRRLTARELECLALLAIGKTLDEAAEILGLSYSTVRFHLQNAERKLGTPSRAHAIAKAAFLGLLGRID
ncbi:MAG: autoinducer binding domain-containing protein [Gammaproteobacteria bacterium]|nr:autoinducer binding domain-containing protein [Gammaproteobacteria bacterium]